VIIDRIPLNNFAGLKDFSSDFSLTDIYLSRASITQKAFGLPASA
jgi:hypothetical protein